MQHNRGKRSLGVDLDDPVGLALIHDLVRNVDVVVENYGPGVMEHHGLAYGNLRALNPGVIRKDGVMPPER